MVGATSSGSHLLTVKAREVGEGGIIDITSLPQKKVWSNGIGDTASAMCMKAVKFKSVVQQKLWKKYQVLTKKIFLKKIWTINSLVRIVIKPQILTNAWKSLS